MAAEGRLLVVCDAGPLIHLGHLGALECLADMGTLLVPEAVAREVEAHRPESLGSPGMDVAWLESIPQRTTLHVRRDLLMEVPQQVQQASQERGQDSTARDL